MPVLTGIAALARCLPSGPQSDVHVIPAAALAWEGERITWVGPEADLPDRFGDWAREDAGGRLVVPGLVDCHTHLAFGGWRDGEFEQRLLGKSYLEIAAAGGGIAATVAATREADTDALLARCLEHLAGMARLGVTTVEAKTGYGLTEEQELRLLGIYRALGSGPQRIVPTLLAAHVVPEEYRGRRGKYVELIVERIIPRAASEGLARFCDAFVEETAFTPDEARRIFEAGKQHGLRPKLHADQLSSGGGAELAAEVGAASADHLERVSEEGIGKLAAGGGRGGGEPALRLALPRRGAAPRPEAARGRRPGGGGHRLQPRQRAELSPSRGDDARLPPPADDAGRGPQGGHDRRGARDRPRGGDRLDRGRQVGGLRGDRCRLGGAVALPPAGQSARADGRARGGDLARAVAGALTGLAYSLGRSDRAPSAVSPVGLAGLPPRTAVRGHARASGHARPLTDVRSGSPAGAARSSGSRRGREGPGSRSACRAALAGPWARMHPRPPSAEGARSERPSGERARAKPALGQPLLDDGEDLGLPLRRVLLEAGPLLENRREAGGILHPAGVGAHVEPRPAHRRPHTERTHSGVRRGGLVSLLGHRAEQRERRLGRAHHLPRHFERLPVGRLHHRVARRLFGVGAPGHAERRHHPAERAGVVVDQPEQAVLDPLPLLGPAGELLPARLPAALVGREVGDHRAERRPERAGQRGGRAASRRHRLGGGLVDELLHRLSGKRGDR